jgi:hypothetical protein
VLGARAKTYGVVAVLSPVKVIPIGAPTLMFEKTRSSGDESPRQAV